MQFIHTSIRYGCNSKLGDESWLFYGNLCNNKAKYNYFTVLIGERLLMQIKIDKLDKRSRKIEFCNKEVIKLPGGIC